MNAVPCEFDCRIQLLIFNFNQKTDSKKLYVLKLRHYAKSFVLL